MSASEARTSEAVAAATAAPETPVGTAPDSPRASATQDAGDAAAAESKPARGWSFLIATVCGLGEIPLAPGTFGALAGVLIYAAIQAQFPPDAAAVFPLRDATLAMRAMWAARTVLPASLLIAAVGVWVSQRVAKNFNLKDPQFVVIDETSGQMLAYTLALAPANWKYLFLGFILFRAFDIWKPFPARQMEQLPGGWGIMADDWAAAVYAALGMWLARLAHL